MNIDVGIKIHNRFDIEVKDIRTGEIVQKAQAENIVLNNMYSYLCSNVNNKVAINEYIHFGKGTGIISPLRTSLFNRLSGNQSTIVETVINSPPTASYCKKKIVITSSEQVGETITEVGIHSANSTSVYTHALLKDSEGNQISIGPKTETQEITIYSTVYATVSLPDGCSLSLYTYSSKILNSLLKLLLGYETSSLSAINTNSQMQLRVSTDKNATNPTTYYSDYISQLYVSFTTHDIPNKKSSTGRVRFDSSVGNGKIWSIAIMGTNFQRDGLMRILFPNTLWQGYNFIGKSIGVGDGSTKKFNLPWSDINTTKEYKIYIDGALKTKNVDYTLANEVEETSVTFADAPASGLAITGDWWVDYIPKDSDHVLDITLTITYGEGA